MVLRIRRRRTGPGPTLTALALLGLVLAVCYLYYETPLLQAGAAAAGLPARPPEPAWTAPLPEDWTQAPPGEVTLSAGSRHVLVVRTAPGGLDLAWYDRFGFVVARTRLAPPPEPWFAAAGLLAGTAVGDEGAALAIVDPASLPAGRAWAPAVPTLEIVPAAVVEAAGMLAAAALGAPAGPDLTPDRLLVLDLRGDDPVVAWSAEYEAWRLLQAAGDPSGLAAVLVDPARGRFRVDLWSWQGERLGQSEPTTDPLRLVAVGAGPTAYVAAGARATVLGPGGAGGTVDLPSAPSRCWPAGPGAACLLPAPAGAGPGELVFLTAGGRLTRHDLGPTGAAWAWPGRGALVAAGGAGPTVTAFGSGGAAWTLDLPVAPRALAAGPDGLAVTDGRRLAWLHWPGGQGP